MANQVTAQLSLNIESTNFTDNKNFEFTNVLTKQGLAHTIQEITTDYAAIGIGSLASTDAGICVFHNLDANNYILYGSTAGEFKLLAGGFAMLRHNTGITIQAKAPTAVVKLEQYLLAE